MTTVVIPVFSRLSSFNSFDLFFLACGFSACDHFCCPCLEPLQWTHFYLRRPQTWHTILVKMLPEQRYLSCLAWSTIAVKPTTKSHFLQQQLQQNSINTNQSFSNKKHSIWIQTQTFVYKNIGAIFSHYQETSVVKIFHICFSNPSLPSGHKPHLVTICRGPTLGSDPIYSSSSSNTVKTTWYYSEDKASLHGEANIFRHNSYLAQLYT